MILFDSPSLFFLDLLVGCLETILQMVVKMADLPVKNHLEETKKMMPKAFFISPLVSVVGFPFCVGGFPRLPVTYVEAIG